MKRAIFALMTLATVASATDTSIALRAVVDAQRFIDRIDNPTNIRDDHDHLFQLGLDEAKDAGLKDNDAELYAEFWAVEVKKLIERGE
jgi:hypothetical protein